MNLRYLFASVALLALPAAASAVTVQETILVGTGQSDYDVRDGIRFPALDSPVRYAFKAVSPVKVSFSTDIVGRDGFDLAAMYFNISTDPDESFFLGTSFADGLTDTTPPTANAFPDAGFLNLAMGEIGYLIFGTPFEFFGLPEDTVSISFAYEVEDRAVSPTPIPLPASAFLLLGGLAGVGFLKRKAA